MSHACDTCGRQLAACEWCGESGYLVDADGKWPVVTQPGWDGNFHEPCHGALQRALLPGR